MPNATIIRNTPALAAEVDARAQAGANVFDRGAGNYSLSATAGLYWNPVALLNGFGTIAGDDLNALLQAALDISTGGGVNISCGIDADDFFWIECDIDFTITGGIPDNALFGFDSAGHGLVTGAPPYRRTAPNPWQRGVFSPTTGIIIDPTGAPLFFQWPIARRSQSLPTWLRIRGTTGDADDVWSGLTLEDADTADASTRWVVMPDGRVQVSWITAAALSDVTWVDQDLMRLLGFNGSETSTVDGSLTVIDAAGYCGPFVASSYMMSEMRARHDGDTHASRMADGSHSSSHQGPYTGWTVRMRVDGKVGSTEDLEAHLHRFWAYALPGRPMTIFPQWGDKDATARGSIETRRHRDLVDAAWVGGGPGSGTLTAYDLQHTSENDARAVNARVGGRVLVVRAPTDPKTRRTDYGGRDLDQFMDLTIEFNADPSR